MTNEQLVISAKKGDISALEQLYTQNSGIIFRNCRPFERLGYETDDLMQEAYFVLLKAVDSYKEDSGYQFVTYLSNSLKWHFSRYVKRDKNRRDLCVLDSPVDEDGETTKADMLPDEAAEFEDSAVYNADMNQVFGLVKDALKGENNGDMMYDILCDVFVAGKTLAEIGRKYSVNGERIRQIRVKALRNLRNPKHKKLHSYREYVIDRSIYHSGFTEFKHTNTSSVEWAVLKMEQKENNHFYDITRRKDTTI